MVADFCCLSAEVLDGTESVSRRLTARILDGVNQTPSSQRQSEAPPPADEARSISAPDERVSGVSLPLRIYTSKHTHRLLPARVAMGIAASIGPAVRQRRNPAERRDAANFMRELLLHTPRAGEADALAKQWLVEKSRVRELFWRPWLLRRSQVHDVRHWQAAHAEGRGCVIVFGHLVAAWAVPAILGLRGFDHYMVAGPHYWEPLPPGYEGMATLFRRQEYGERAIGHSRLIPADAPPTRLLQLLEAGESVGIAFDVPGWAATPFLGRNVALGGGAATLAFKTKVKLLPVIPERHGASLDLRLLPPLDPADYPDPRSLRIAIARTFEPFVLGRPETVELAWNPSPLVTEAPPPPQAGGDRNPTASVT
jgi:lauroyl/myristoyl acyltransferase